MPIQEIVGKLLRAEQDRAPLPRFSETYPGFTPQDAYAVQLAWVEAKKSSGARVVGKKIGLTSPKMQEMFGVNEPDYGHLLDFMLHESGGKIPSSSLVQPKVEAEIAFVLQRDLRGPGVTREAVLEATECVIPALEIIDSRFANWKITLPDTVSDNASSGRVVLNRAAARSVTGLDLAAVEMTLEKNGTEISRGLAAAVQGHPAMAVAWLANKFAEFGQELRAGELIMSGAIAGAFDANAKDQFRAHLTGLGTVEVTFG
ncbi:MAG: 2-keto-4-pentenoate hydratase [Candidatus Binatia bacterium]